MKKPKCPYTPPFRIGKLGKLYEPKEDRKTHGVVVDRREDLVTFPELKGDCEIICYSLNAVYKPKKARGKHGIK